MKDGALQDPELLRRLLRAKDRMGAEPEKDWKIADLARISGTSSAHFARSFKSAFGVPPHRYLLSLRLERAKRLLAETELAITEIASRCGWRSLGTFGRTFRTVVGQSPGAFRASAAQQVDAQTLVPPCVLRAAARPDLKIAVSEKRRTQESG